MSRVTNTGLAKTVERSNELSTSSDEANVAKRVEVRVLLALKYPRDEDEKRLAIHKACTRPAFIERGLYLFPRGNSEVFGLSIYTAREMARLWGNIEYSCEIVADDDESRKIRAMAWDLQTNTQVTAEDFFRKRHQRKQKDNSTHWVPVDERDLRELTNRYAAYAVRNCILQLIPEDLKDEIKTAMFEMRRSKVTQGAKPGTPAATTAVKKTYHDLIKRYAALHPPVTKAMLDQWLDGKIEQASADDLTRLDILCGDIERKETTWNRAMQGEDVESTSQAAQGPVSGDTLGKPTGRAEERPHGRGTPGKQREAFDRGREGYD